MCPTAPTPDKENEFFALLEQVKEEGVRAVWDATKDKMENTLWDEFSELYDNNRDSNKFKKALAGGPDVDSTDYPFTLTHSLGAESSTPYWTGIAQNPLQLVQVDYKGEQKVLLAGKELKTRLEKNKLGELLVTLKEGETRSIKYDLTPNQLEKLDQMIRHNGDQHCLEVVENLNQQLPFLQQQLELAQSTRQSPIK